jgi:hypothetical protein
MGYQESHQAEGLSHRATKGGYNQSNILLITNLSSNPEKVARRALVKIADFDVLPAIFCFTTCAGNGLDENGLRAPSFWLPGG